MKTTSQSVAVNEQQSLNSAQLMIAVAIIGLLAAIAMPYLLMA